MPVLKALKRAKTYTFSPYMDKTYKPNDVIAIIDRAISSSNPRNSPAYTAHDAENLITNWERMGGHRHNTPRQHQNGRGSWSSGWAASR